MHIHLCLADWQDLDIVAVWPQRADGVVVSRARRTDDQMVVQSSASVALDLLRDVHIAQLAPGPPVLPAHPIKKCGDLLFRGLAVWRQMCVVVCKRHIQVAARKVGRELHLQLLVRKAII